MQNDRSFFKYQLQEKKNHNSIISRENREFRPIFVEIIAFDGKNIKKNSAFKNYQPQKNLISRITCEKSRTLPILGKIMRIYPQKINSLKNSTSGKS